MDYRKLGLISNRYQVRRSDGSELDPSAKHFVLRYDKNDKWGEACRVALRALCSEIAFNYPKLSKELLSEIDEI